MVEGVIWCPQIKDVAHVSRSWPGVSGRVVINEKSMEKEAGEGKHTQAVRRPMGPTVRTQSSKWSG
jgi:hypothetical protein